MEKKKRATLASWCEARWNMAKEMLDSSLGNTIFGMVGTPSTAGQTIMACRMVIDNTRSHHLSGKI